MSGLDERVLQNKGRDDTKTNQYIPPQVFLCKSITYSRHHSNRSRHSNHHNHHNRHLL